MSETVSLANARIEVEERPGYLYMVEHGTLRSVDEVQRYATAMEDLADRTGLRRALIDSRLSEPVEPPKDVRDAMWRWLLSARAFDQIAFLLKDEMHVARVNMTALSQRASVKAFAQVHEAHRWLSGRQRTLSQGIPVSGVPRTPPPPRGLGSTPPSMTPPSMTPPSMTPSSPGTITPAATTSTPATTASPATSRSSEISIGSSAPGSATRTGRFRAARPASTPAMPAVRPRPSEAAPDDEDGADEEP